MRFQAYRKSLRVPSKWQTTISYPFLLPTIQMATDRDREVLRAAKERLGRQECWNRRSMLVGMALGSAAIIAAVFAHQSFLRWPLLAAATMEISVLPWYTASACRRLRHTLALMEIDVQSGCVAEGRGRLRTLVGVRAIQDARTGRLRALLPGVFKPGELRGGSNVDYRYASRSGIVLSVAPKAQEATSPLARCSTTPTRSAYIHINRGGEFAARPTLVSRKEADVSDAS